ncbi:MAG TPA: hypothetical protein VFI47_12955 [Acidimicrobiales bacterium]|nr:hypothetical protein [Acidimicrobiales bacterium]
MSDALPSSDWWPPPALAQDPALDRAAARSRHPSARPWHPDRAGLLDRLAAAARARGAPWPRVAAAMLLLRGIAGDDRATFAARLGVGLATLDRLESGGVPASAVPACLRAVTDLVDWRWVDADMG